APPVPSSRAGLVRAPVDRDAPSHCSTVPPAQPGVQHGFGEHLGERRIRRGYRREKPRGSVRLLASTRAEHQECPGNEAQQKRSQTRNRRAGWKLEFGNGIRRCSIYLSVTPVPSRARRRERTPSPRERRASSITDVRERARCAEGTPSAARGPSLCACTRC